MFSVSHLHSMVSDPRYFRAFHPDASTKSEKRNTMYCERSLPPGGHGRQTIAIPQSFTNSTHSSIFLMKLRRLIRLYQINGIKSCTQLTLFQGIQVV